MSLDYNGIPKQSYTRDLNDTSRYSGNLQEDIKPIKDDEATELFNDVAKVFIKGNKLITALGQLNPAAFIPVEEDSAVRSSLARLDELQDRITFGLFQDACKFINSRGEAIDEAFIINLKTIDPINLNSDVVRMHKGVGNSSKDWLTEFLTKLSPLAGLTIMGFLNDLAFSKSGKSPNPDGENSGTQSIMSHLQGIGIGIALLIEAGITLAGLDILTEPFKSDEASNEVASMYNQLKSDPNRRREVLENGGYDYEALKKNKKYDDYLAVKQYALEYISRLIDNVQYDHWIAFANVGDNQSLLSSALSMAPMYSLKWRRFNQTNDVATLEKEVYEYEEDSYLEQAVASGLNRGLRDYFSSLLSISNDHYDKTLQVYSMQIDARVICCLVWFLGPMNLDNLKKMANILHILGARSTLNWKSLLSRLGEGMARSIANMLLGYVGVLVESVFDKILSAMFKIPDSDLEVALKNCIGLEMLFNLLQEAWLEIFEQVNKLVTQLNNMLNDLKNKGSLSVEIAAERRYLVTLAGILRAVINNIEAVQQNCSFNRNLTESQINDIAAEAAVDFVSSQIVDNTYPTIELSEDLRRKFFSGVPEFTTSRLKLPVPGTDEAGKQQDLTRDDKISECGEGGRAAAGIAIGKRIADIMNS